MDKVKEAIQSFNNGVDVTLYEPCNCGSQIRHNNGGNYHEIITVYTRGKRFFVKYDDTCELTDDAFVKEISPQEARNIIRKHGDWL